MRPAFFKRKMELSQNPQISSDIGTKGFDLSAGKTWIYPENYPVRDYQFSIVEASLYSNTLVCLPTGLGKTFIAAVVMYNFWRWYPRGKVVFLAPTRPLVAQQIFACHNTMGIPSIESIELTGATNQKQREIAWSKKRVFFATPQVFHNDLEKDIVPSDLVKCVVIDEAHKALGKHSYCECVRILSERNQTFRILALSATPGNKIDNVHEVLQNLLIAHVELRDETSLDIVPYINKRKVDIILVPLNDKLAGYKDRYVHIMDRHVKVLLQCNVLQGHASSISKGRIFHLLKEHQKKTNKSGNYGQIMKTLNILMTMYHAYELMVRDGLRAFHKFYQNHSDKYWMNEEPHLRMLLEDIDGYLGPFPDAKALHEDEIDNIPRNLVFGHTKFDKLKELLLRHFTCHGEESTDTRAIVFVEYRDIVSEIYILLLQCRPLIRPQMFVGQAGQKQKQQIKALENFRNNFVNVLISTSIGEEGLDVGEVDLIICFDISQHSPTRLVQRMGRTGRKRDGHIVILVTDGREHETLKSTMARRDSLNTKVLNKNNIFSSLYQNNPRMIPDNLSPECLKMYINVQPKSPAAKRKRNGKEKSGKLENKRINVPKSCAGIDTKLATQANGTRFTMMKYLKGAQAKKDCPDLARKGSICGSIKPSDVKILTCDNDAVDFLTLCALRNSEAEGNKENEQGIDHSHVPECPRIEHFFNFSVPDIAILDCLHTMRTTVSPNSGKLHAENDERNNDEDASFIHDSLFEDAMAGIDEEFNAVESKFEDLLDESSKSDGGEVLFERDKRLGNGIPSETAAAEKRSTPLDLKPGEFEDILNDTSDDSEARASESELCSTASKTVCGDSFGDASRRPVKSNESIKSSNACLQRVNNASVDFDLATENRKRNLGNTEKNCRNSGDSDTLSITQAIDEIARINSNLSGSDAVDGSDADMFEDESCFLEIDTAVDLEKNVGDVVDEREHDQRIVLNGARNGTDEKSTDEAEFKVEEYEWDDDFEISIEPVERCSKFDSPEESAADKKSTIVGREKIARNSDSEEWFSVEKTFHASKRNSSGSSLARKLANARNSLRPVHERVGNAPPATKRDPRKSDSKSRGLEGKSCYFLDDSADNFPNESNDSKDSSFTSVCGNERRKPEGSRSRVRHRKSKRRRNEFIEDEAELSSNDDTTDGSSGVDEDLEDFVSYSQNVHDTSDMLAHYLQTVRSPVNRPDGFLFKQPRTPDAGLEIYSQVVVEEDESYIHDSFCVAGDENGDQDVSRVTELSELERAELELESKRRKRKRKGNEESVRSRERKMRKTKRRNVVNFCSSSEDETEKLREQIRDESLLLSRRPEPF